MSVPISEALWLVKNNVPFDVAFALDDARGVLNQVLGIRRAQIQLREHGF
jgi:hypothetical protein